VTNLDRKIVLNLVQCPGRGEATKAVRGKFPLWPRKYTFAITQLLRGKHKTEVCEIARFRQLDAHKLSVLGQCLGLPLRLVPLVVVHNLFIDADRNLLYRHPLRFVQPVRIRAELDVDTDGVERSVRPAR